MAVLEPLDTLAGELAEACVDSPPAHLREGGLIRDGYDARLDEARSLQRDANDWLARYQKKLIEASRIDSLKVGYNKVFGYYIELTAANRAKVKDHEEPFKSWTRKQTLKNAERFITPELKEFESKVLSAEGRAIEREQSLFRELCDRAQRDAEALRTFRHDRGGARRAVLLRRQGEPGRVREAGRSWTSRCCTSRRAGTRCWTRRWGRVSCPTMWARFPGSGFRGPERRARSLGCASPGPRSPDPRPRRAKRRFARAHHRAEHGGQEHVYPADRAAHAAGPRRRVRARRRGDHRLCDRIFTRIGAADELHLGQSTFMVEMTETANICHHATERSLVILDEIGRGTSTLDGLSLAWAIAEHLADVRCRTLFATHYHELTAMAEQRGNVTNLHVTVREWRDEVVFLHRIVPGATDRSYGIHVAKIAGLPPGVVARAKDLLSRLAVQHGPGEAAAPAGDGGGVASGGPVRHGGDRPSAVLPLFESELEPEPHPVLEAIRELELDRLTPMQCFDLLRQWQERLDDDTEGS